MYGKIKNIADELFIQDNNNKQYYPINSSSVTSLHLYEQSHITLIKNVQYVVSKDEAVILKLNI